MAEETRSDDRGQGRPKPGPGGDRRNNNPRKRMFYYRKKVCRICTKDFSGEIDYKNIGLLRKFVTEKGKIVPRRLSGTCAKHQRVVTRAIKQARTIAMLPFTEK